MTVAPLTSFSISACKIYPHISLGTMYPYNVPTLTGAVSLLGYNEPNLPGDSEDKIDGGNPLQLNPLQLPLLWHRMATGLGAGFVCA